MTTSFIYEGSDDNKAWSLKVTLTAETRSTVREPADYGNYAQMLTLFQGLHIAFAGVPANGSSTQTLSAMDTAILTPGQTISVRIGVSQSASWDASRESGAYPDSPFDGTVSATVKRFVLRL